MKKFLQSISSLRLNHSSRVVVSYKRKYVHKVLVNHLFKCDENVGKQYLKRSRTVISPLSDVTDYVQSPPFI